MVANPDTTSQTSNPTYETSADVAREIEFSNRICQVFKCSSMRFPQFSEIDCMLYKQSSPIAFAELKCRTHDSTKHDSVFLSEHKIATGMKLHRSYGRWKDRQDIPFMFFVRFSDKDMYCKITEEVIQASGTMRLTARNHADNPKDTEWVKLIPMRFFKEF